MLSGIINTENRVLEASIIHFKLSISYLGTITLNEPLFHDHLIHRFLESSDLTSAEPPQTAQQWWGDGGELAPEVGVITRNIVIQGVVILIL